MAVDRTTLTRVLAVANGKGGVGKTTIATHLSGLLAAAGYRILLIDLDPQANVAEDLGYVGEAHDDDGAELLRAVTTRTGLVPVRGIRTNLDVAPGGDHLVALEGALFAMRQHDHDANEALATSIAPIGEDYDLIIIDCPPGNATLQEAALVAARWVLVPVRSDAGSRKGLRTLASRFTAARAHNPDLQILGVVLFGLTSGAHRLAADARAALEADLGGVVPVLNSTIRYVEAPAKAARDRGLLAHELEAVAAAAPRWYERLRRAKDGGSGNKDGGEAVLPATAASLAGDHQALAEEVLARLISHLQENEEVPA